MPLERNISQTVPPVSLKVLAVTEGSHGIYGLHAALREAGARNTHVVTVHPRDMRKAIDAEHFNLLLLQDSPPRCDALELMKASADIPVIILCEHDNISRVLAALRAGAYDALTRRQAADGMIPFALRRLVCPPHQLQEDLVQQLERHLQVEEALQESNRRFRLALKNSPVSVWFQDQDLRYTWVYNFAPILLRSDEEIIGHTDEELFGPDASRRLTELKQLTLQRGERVTREVGLQQDGRAVYLSLILEPVQDERGRMCGLRCASINVTGARHTEEELRLAQEELALINRRLQEVTGTHPDISEMVRAQAELLSVVPDAIVVRDLDDRIAFWNQGAERLYGYTQDEARGFLAHELLGTESTIPIDEVKATAIRDGVCVTELHQKTKEGRAIVVQSLWAVRRSAAGEPVAFLQINRDITPLKRWEEERDRVHRTARQLFRYHRRSPLSEPTICKPCEAIEDVVTLAGTTLNMPDVRIAVDVTEASAPVKLQEDALKQVLFNVLERAVEDAPPGGEVHIHAGLRENALQVSVTGPRGLPEDELGLGVLTIQSLIERAGGTIHFLGEAEEGGRCQFELPVIIV